jgi:hypothetical protein
MRLAALPRAKCTRRNTPKHDAVSSRSWDFSDVKLGCICLFPVVAHPPSQLDIFGCVIFVTVRSFDLLQALFVWMRWTMCSISACYINKVLIILIMYFSPHAQVMTVIGCLVVIDSDIDNLSVFLPDF